MKTKALFLAGLLFAVGAASSSAQTPVYSVNAVGYVTVSLAPGEFKIIGNPLNVVTNGVQTNTINNVLPTAPNDVVKIYTFDRTVQGFTGIFTKHANGWSGGGATKIINPGEGFFVQSLAPTNISLTFVGEVPQGTNMTINLARAGFNLLTAHTPVGGLLETDLGLPVQNADNQHAETVYLYRNSSYIPYTRRLAWSGGIQPSLSVGEGFYYLTTTNTPVTWVKSFSTGI